MTNDQLYFYNRGFNDCLAKIVDHNPADLTDEEIIDVVESVFGTFYSMMACNNSWVDFARAILRKAQEQ